MRTLLNRLNFVDCLRLAGVLFDVHPQIDNFGQPLQDCEQEQRHHQNQ